MTQNERYEKLRLCQLQLKPVIDFDIADVLKNWRPAHIVLQRAIIAYFLRKTNNTVVRIGDILRRDHSTITYLVTRYMFETKERRQMVDKIDKIILRGKLVHEADFLRQEIASMEKKLHKIVLQELGI